MSDFTLKKIISERVDFDAPLLFVILDGVGLYKGQAEGYPGNALDLADAPVLKDLLKNAPLSTQIQAHGTAVGMPSDADMGNSEVGHNAMGAGRVFDQGAKLVANAIADDSLFQGATWSRLIGSKTKPGLALEKDKHRALHFIGLLSDGNVHSHIDHLLAMIERCHQEGVERLFVHVLADGRDVEKTSAPKYVQQLEDKLKTLDPGGRHYAIASGGGRQVITMDRYEADWNMVELAWQTHVKGEGRLFDSALEAIETLRKENNDVIDQDLPPFVIGRDGQAIAPIKDDDVVIFYNFRGDRAIEISRAFTEDENFTPFKRDPRVKVHYAGMMEYDGDLHIPPAYLVAPPAIDRTISEFLVKNKVYQYSISETQKFGHVTFFWNGNNSEKFSEEFETWVEIPSDKISFDRAPRMKADEITDALLPALEENKYKFLKVNYANGDMVGHTGVLPAAIESVEALDQNLKRILTAAEAAGARVLVTADHGNCDQMLEINKKGEVVQDGAGEFVSKTSHTLSPVPFILVGKNAEDFEVNPDLEKPGLGNLAATALTLMGFEAPEGYLPSIVKVK